MDTDRTLPPRARARRLPRSFRRPRSPRAQRGVALAISLVLLVAMTVVGIATLAGTRLSEKMSSNAQQKSVAFEVAESVIDTVWTPSALMASVGAIPESEFDEPAAVAPAVEGVVEGVDLRGGFDQRIGTDGHLSVDVDGEVTIRYCGESPLPRGSSLSADESDVQMVGVLFDVNGLARIDGSGTTSDHVQRGALVRPRTGRRGKCDVPGIAPSPGS